MAVITALPEKECDLGDCGSWICLLLSAVIAFLWQCVGCKLLMSYRQTGCGCLENVTREMIKIQGDRKKNGLGQLHPSWFFFFSPGMFWFYKVIYEKFSKQGETSVSPFLQGRLLDQQSNLDWELGKREELDQVRVSGLWII